VPKAALFGNEQMGIYFQILPEQQAKDIFFA
jgi:hypothetical protein